MTIQPLDDAPAPLAPVGDWMPTKYTKPLTEGEDFRTDGDRLLRFGLKHIKIAEAAVLTLDAWQQWLIRHVLERYPEDWPVEHLRGQLRYRQVVISMGRQNGKSLLGVFFVLYFLCLHVRGPRVIGLASVDRQAKIVYGRAHYAVKNSPALKAELRPTATRGIWRRDESGVYLTLPAKEDSAQGEPGSGILFDELHLALAALWDAMVLAMKSKRNALMIGLTTAGDDASELLLRLYDEGEAAIRGEDERFGFFLWEAATEELTEANVIAANPAVACGRISLAQTMDDARKMWNDTKKGKDGLTGRQRCIRYTLNRFIGGAADAWTNTHLWHGAAVEPDAVVTRGVPGVVFSVERTESWEWASIRATVKAGDGYATELVASIKDPDPDTLLAYCRALAGAGARSAFAVDRKTLDDLGKQLQADGYTVYRLTEGEAASASQHAHQLITRRVVAHPDDSLCRLQIGRGRRRDGGEGGWRLSRSLSGVDIDTALNLTTGLYVAAIRDEAGVQVF